ncbi:MAG: Lysine-tRNA ligase [Firmicutes bacterium]|nr:Lysine-tRNA ligase [Bacillota bacterium]
MVPSVKTIFLYFTWLMRAKALVEGSSKIGIGSVLICKLERFCPSKKLSDNLRFSGKSLTKMRQVKKSEVPRRPAKEKSFAGYFLLGYPCEQFCIISWLNRIVQKGFTMQSWNIDKGALLLLKRRFSVMTKNEMVEQNPTGAEDRKGQHSQEKTAVAPLAPQITLDDFSRIDLRVCRVMKCEALKRSRNLLRLELDDGLCGRVIVSGIHPWYEPEELIGKKIVVIANLEPAKFSNVTSQGMLLAGDTSDGECKVLFVDEAIPVGFRIH